MIRVIMADDQTILRESLKFIIEQDEEIEVVASAVNGREAFELCGKYLPDLVLMDVKMPECDGLEGTRLIKEKYSSVKVLILTTFSDSENISEALKYNADGYVLKDIRPEELISAIKNTVKGLSVIQHKVLQTVVEKLNSPEEKKGEEQIDTTTLTGRETSIIQLIVNGKGNREIADLLYLSEGRVRNIITELLSKLELKDRTQLAVYAVKRGFV